MPEDSFRLIIAGPSGSGKTNTLLHMIYHLLHFDKILLFAKNLYQDKYQFLLNDLQQELIPKWVISSSKLREKSSLFVKLSREMKAKDLPHSEYPLESFLHAHPLKGRGLRRFCKCIRIGVLDNCASKFHSESVNKCSGDILNKIVVRMPACKINVE